MKPSDVDWSDQASRFAYSDWLEEQGRFQEAEMVRQRMFPPIEIPADGDNYSVDTEDGSFGIGCGDTHANVHGDGYVSSFVLGDGVNYGLGDGDGHGYGFEFGVTWQIDFEGAQQ